MCRPSDVRHGAGRGACQGCPVPQHPLNCGVLSFISQSSIHHQNTAPKNPWKGARRSSGGTGAQFPSRGPKGSHRNRLYKCASWERGTACCLSAAYNPSSIGEVTSQTEALCLPLRPLSPVLGFSGQKEKKHFLSQP